MAAMEAQVLRQHYKREGDANFNNQRWSLALKNYTAALNFSKRDKSALVARSKCYLRIGMFRKAMDDVESALSLHTHDPEAIYQKATVFYRMGNYEMAILYFHRGQKLRPDIPAFREGMEKCQRCIDEYIKGQRMKITAAGDISLYIPSKKRPYRRVRQALVKLVKSPQPGGAVTPGFRRRRLHPLVQLDRRARPIVSPYNKKRPGRPDGLSDLRLRRILGELYGDKKYLERLLEKTRERTRVDGFGQEVNEFAEDGLHFLFHRLMFWGSFASLVPPPPVVNRTDHLERFRRIGEERRRLYGYGLHRKKYLNVDVRNFRNRLGMYRGVLPESKYSKDEPAEINPEDLRFLFKTYKPPESQQGDKRGINFSTEEFVHAVEEVEQQELDSDDEDEFEDLDDDEDDDLDDMGRDDEGARTGGRTTRRTTGSLRSAKQSALEDKRDSIYNFIAHELDEIEEDWSAEAFDSCRRKAEALMRRVLDFSDDDVKDKYEVLARLHSYLGNVALHFEDLDKAFFHHRKDLAIGEEHDYDVAISRGLGNLGRTFVFQKKYQHALEAFARKYKYVSTAIEHTWLFYEIGQCFLNLKQYEFAIDSAKKSLAAAEEAESRLYKMRSTVLMAVSQARMSKYERSFGNFERAYDHALLAQDDGAQYAIKKACEELNGLMKREMDTKLTEIKKKRDAGGGLTPRKYSYLSSDNEDPDYDPLGLNKMKKKKRRKRKGDGGDDDDDDDEDDDDEDDDDEYEDVIGPDGKVIRRRKRRRKLGPDGQPLDDDEDDDDDDYEDDDDDYEWESYDEVDDDGNVTRKRRRVRRKRRKGEGDDDDEDDDEEDGAGRRGGAGDGEDDDDGEGGRGKKWGKYGVKGKGTGYGKGGLIRRNKVDVRKNWRRLRFYPEVNYYKRHAMRRGSKFVPQQQESDEAVLTSHGNAVSLYKQPVRPKPKKQTGFTSLEDVMKAKTVIEKIAVLKNLGKLQTLKAMGELDPKVMKTREEKKQETVQNAANAFKELLRRKVEARAILAKNMANQNLSPTSEHSSETPRRGQASNVISPRPAKASLAPGESRSKAASVTPRLAPARGNKQSPTQPPQELFTPRQAAIISESQKAKQPGASPTMTEKKKVESSRQTGSFPHHIPRTGDPSSGQVTARDDRTSVDTKLSLPPIASPTKGEVTPRTDRTGAGSVTSRKPSYGNASPTKAGSSYTVAARNVLASNGRGSRMAPNSQAAGGGGAGAGTKGAGGAGEGGTGGAGPSGTGGGGKVPIEREGAKQAMSLVREDPTQRRQSFTHQRMTRKESFGAASRVSGEELRFRHRGVAGLSLRTAGEDDDEAASAGLESDTVTEVEESALPEHSALPSSNMAAPAQAVA